MNWEYRVVRKKISKDQFLYQIKQICYDKNENIDGYVDAPIPYGESIEDIKNCLSLMSEGNRKTYY